MVKVNRRYATAAMVAAFFALAGCSNSSEDTQTTGETAPNIVQPGAPGEPARTLTPEQLEDIEPPRYTEG